jgi:hypothetical protein
MVYASHREARSREESLMTCPAIVWPHFATGAGVMLGEDALQEARRRHEEALQEARTRASQVRDAHDRVIQGGQG